MCSKKEKSRWSEASRVFQHLLLSYFPLSYSKDSNIANIPRKVFGLSTLMVNYWDLHIYRRRHAIWNAFSAFYVARQLSRLLMNNGILYIWRTYACAKLLKFHKKLENFKVFLANYRLYKAYNFLIIVWNIHSPCIGLALFAWGRSLVLSDLTS